MSLLRPLAIAITLVTASAASAHANTCGDRIGAVVSQAVHAALEVRRPEIETNIRNELGRGDLIARGFTLYDINVRMGQPAFDYTNGQIRWRIPANHIYAKSTTPGPLGSWADPAVEVSFDVLVSGQMRIAPDGPPRAEWVTGQVTRAVATPRNASGAVATTLVRVAQMTEPGGRAIENAVNTYLVRDLTSIVNNAIGGAGFPQPRSAPVTGQQQTTRFTSPTYNCGGEIVRADWCARWGADCGQPAAQAFCTSRNFRMATHFEAMPGAGRTWVPRDRRICDGPGCTSFRSITCSNSPALTDTYVRTKRLTEGATVGLPPQKR
ncbi:MAG: hypothetical protein JNM47_09970 [Hyphomonadaceae bacterium]|nr:hypothetical protein [Hyphomonadaceae bacterium]